jgi:hypothetical protein
MPGPIHLHALCYIIEGATVRSPLPPFAEAAAGVAQVASAIEEIEAEMARADAGQ